MFAMFLITIPTCFTTASSILGSLRESQFMGTMLNLISLSDKETSRNTLFNIEKMKKMTLRNPMTDQLKMPRNSYLGSPGQLTLRLMPSYTRRVFNLQEDNNHLNITLIAMFGLIITISAVLTCSSAVYFYIFHQKLSSRVHHKSQCGLSLANSKPRNIESVPECVFTDKYFALHDHASTSVLRGALPSIPTEILFTKLVRRNMTTFTHFPQALMIRLVCDTPEEIRSFKASHISSLDFNEGDLVCGVYRVIARRKNKVEFEIKMVNMDFCCARLSLSFHEMGDEVVFCSETMMWRPAGECQNMPLEKPVIRWMHETGAWWLIESGVKYLTELES